MMRVPGVAGLLVAGLLLAAASPGSDAGADAAAPRLIVRAGEGGSVDTAQGGGQIVMLEAVAARGHFFAAWHCVEGVECPEGVEGRRSPRIEVTVAGALAVEARFEADPVQANLTVLQAAGGTASTDCGAICTRREGTEVQVRAVPDERHRFNGWICEGGNACLGFDRADPAPRVVLQGSVVLTPIYAATAAGGAAVRSVEGGSWRLAAECSASCAAGGEWTAVASAVPGASHVFRGWGCADAAACPRDVAEAGGTELRLSVDGRLALAPEFGEFRVIAQDIIDFAGTSRTVERQAICNVPGECLYAISRGSVRLRVDTLQASQRTYQWSLMSDSPRLSLGNQGRNGVDLLADGGLDEIVTAVVEVNSPRFGSAPAARDTLTVVAVPAALAVLVGGGGSGRCSGFVARHGGEHFVVTAAHCLTKYDADLELFGLEEELEVRIGGLSDPLNLTARIRGADQLTDVGVLEIPDPGLDWIPEVSVSSPFSGEDLQVVGYPITADLVADDSAQLSVTAGLAADAGFDCEERHFGVSTFAAGGLPNRCDADFLHIVPNASSPRGSGGPVLNSSGQVAAVISSGAVRQDSGEATRVALIGDQLERLFQGGRRCFEEITRQEVINGETITFLEGWEFYECVSVAAPEADGGG